MKVAFFLAVSTIFWGINFHLAKVLLGQVGFVEAGFWRYLFGISTLLVLAARKLPSPQLLFDNLKGITAVGVVGLFGFNIFFFLGLMHTSAVNAALIVSLNPALTIFLSYKVLGTPLLRKHIIGILISFIGVAYLLLKGDLSNLFELAFSYGDILILIANLLFALNHIWVKKYSVNISTMDFTIFTNLFCFLGFLLLLPISGMENIMTHTPGFWYAVIGIGCFGTGIAYYTWNNGIKLSGADRAGVFMNIVPLSTAVFSVFFNESLYLYHLISGIIILMGLYVMKNKNRKGIA